METLSNQVQLNHVESHPQTALKMCQSMYSTVSAGWCFIGQDGQLSAEAPRKDVDQRLEEVNKLVEARSFSHLV